MTVLPDLEWFDALGDRVRALLMGHFDRLGDGDVELKRRRDLLTVADTAAEAMIVEAIRADFPEHSILAEESGADIRSSEFCWIVDPVDGTTNFARSLPMFAASVALCRLGEPVLAMVEGARLGERFLAAKGGGAFLNGERIEVSGAEGVSTALLATGFAYVRNEVERDNVDNFNRLILASHDIRRGGAASLDLAYVAAGRLDGFWEPYLKPWDVAAGALLVREAGGVVSDFSDGEDWLFGENIVADNGLFPAELLGQLSPVEAGREPWGREIEARLRGGA